MRQIAETEFRKRRARSRCLQMSPAICCPFQQAYQGADLGPGQYRPLAHGVPQRPRPPVVLVLTQVGLQLASWRTWAASGVPRPVSACLR